MTATIWLRALSGGWQPVSTEIDAGIWHEELVCSSDQWGPKEASFTLRRPARALFPDLLTRTPVIIEEGGVRIWRGRIKETPEQTGADRQISVQCRGGQYHLDDDAFERVYVDSKLDDWKDVRGGGPLGKGAAFAAGSLSNDRGSITLMIPAGTPCIVSDHVGVILDLGPNSTLTNLSIDCTTSGAPSAGIFQLQTFTCTNPAYGGAVQTSLQSLSGAIAATQTLGPFTASRYMVVRLINTTAGTPAGDVFVKITGLRAYAAAAYVSANQSILTADMIIEDALSRGTIELSADRSGITADTFAFPDFQSDAPRTPREWWTAANAAVNWRSKIDENLRPIFAPRPTAPVVEIGAWEGAESDNGSSNSDEDIVTKVIVRGTGPDGAPISATRTQTGTIIDRQGGVQTKTLDASYALNATLANKLGDTYLAAHEVSPYKGQTLVSTGVRRVLGGALVRPAHLLLFTSELLRLANRVDPDTGALWRSCTIDQVTYRDADNNAEIDLDNTRNDFEALNERLGILIPS